MSNPRKFSEKIALHNQKQLEETAAFQQIMKEVNDVRPLGGGPPTPTLAGPQTIMQTMHHQHQQHHHHQLDHLQHEHQIQHSAQQEQDHPNHLSISLSGYRGHGGSLPNVNQMAQHGEKGMHSPRGGYPPSSSPRSQKSSIGPVRIKPSHRETSPYASPPSVSMLSNSMTSTSTGGFGTTGNLPGRLNSYTQSSYLSPPMDSSCRRFNSDSALNLNTLLIPSTVPDSSEDSSNNSNDYNAAGLSSGFNRHSPIDSAITLTNLLTTASKSRMGNGNIDPSPLLEIPQVPVSMSSTGSLPDLTNFQYPPPLQNPIDGDDQYNHSPYSTSPLTGSSITYSPTSSHASPQGAGNGQPQPPSSLPNRPQSSSQLPQSPHSPGSHTPQHHPALQENNPLHINTTFQNFPNDNMLSAYRCPQRPSPQNSPSPLSPFRSASPGLDGQLSGPSSPQAPVASSPRNEYYLTQQAQALQQHFEQISVADRNKSNPMLSGRQWRQGTNAVGGPYLFSAIGYPNPMVAAAVTSQQSPQHQQPQTPQTPSSIPDIIFTDFSDPREADQLQLEELLASEQMQAAFRDGLGQIDFDGFQMLDQPDLVQLDPQVEDSFRLDRL